MSFITILMQIEMYQKSHADMKGIEKIVVEIVLYTSLDCDK